MKIVFFDVWSTEYDISGISIGRTVKVRNAKRLECITNNEKSSEILYFDMFGVLFDKTLVYMKENVCSKRTY